MGGRYGAGLELDRASPSCAQWLKCECLGTYSLMAGTIKGAGHTARGLEASAEHRQGRTATVWQAVTVEARKNMQRAKRMTDGGCCLHIRKAGRIACRTR